MAAYVSQEVESCFEHTFKSLFIPDLLMNGWCKAFISFKTRTVYVITIQTSLTLWAAKIFATLSLCVFLCYRPLNVGVISFSSVRRTDHELNSYLSWPDPYRSQQLGKVIFFHFNEFGDQQEDLRASASSNLRLRV